MKTLKEIRSRLHALEVAFATLNPGDHEMIEKSIRLHAEFSALTWVISKSEDESP